MSKQGKRLSAPTFCQYWGIVKAAAGLDFEVYAVTKHLGVHRLWLAGCSARTICTLAGWSERDTDAMLEVYGHKRAAAQDEIDALYATEAEEVEA